VYGVYYGKRVIMRFAGVKWININDKTMPYAVYENISSCMSV